MQAGPAIMVGPNAEENGNPKPGPNDEGSESNYGCLEDGEMPPICGGMVVMGGVADTDAHFAWQNRDRSSRYRQR